ncbi:MAG: glutamyl-tRNA amidotransferase [Candidatus Omnitrophica bacterium CG11_big_fil_rev_8_21_14_0_20_64_10]|nr:MAG: glutamyl-tRNA amidotransferase [Candidatus Omnitrophica bacterium CG11_big_fil_rev_8_21_14_0_20_64_10]
MSLYLKVQEDLKEAMKARQAETVSALRLLKAALQNKEMETGKPPTDAEGVEVLRKLIKQREEAVEAYEKAGRAEQAEKEKREQQLLSAYLPAQMAPEKLKAVVAETIQELGVSGPKAMGQVMKAVMAKVGAQADGKAVSAAVREGLGA